MAKATQKRPVKSADRKETDGERKTRAGLSLRKRWHADGTVTWYYRVDLRWDDYERVTLDYDSVTAAKADKASIIELRQNNRVDLVNAIAHKRTTVSVLREYGREHNIPFFRVPAPPDAPVPTVGVLRDAWLAAIEPKTATSPRTLRPYSEGTKERYRECIRFVIERLKRKDRTMPKDVDRAALKTALSVAKGPNRNRRLTAVQAWVRWCLEDRGVTFPLTPPDFRALKVKETPTGIGHAVLDDELERICAQSDPAYADMWRVLAHTGMRIDECQTLRRCDLKSDGSMVMVPLGKSPKAKRDIPVLEPAVQAVLAALHAGVRGDEALVWPKPMQHYGTVRARWGRACRDAGLSYALPEAPKSTKVRRRAKHRPFKGRVATGKPAPKPEPLEAKWPQVPRPKKSLHGLRHHYGVLLSKVGAPPHVHRTLMGHGSSGLTDRYTQAEADAQDIERMRKMYGLMGQLPGQIPPASPPSPPVPPAIPAHAMRKPRPHK